MRTASRFLRQDEKDAIVRALEDAESRSAGEIVPVLATRSGHYDRAEDVVSFLAAILILGVFWLCFQGVDHGGEEWIARPRVALGFGWVALILLLGFSIGELAASFFPELCLPFITRKEMEEAVERRAHEAFSRFRVGKTSGSTGILIFVSIFEHRVRIDGDDAIDAKLREEDWNEVRDAIVDGLRRKRAGEGLCQGILKAGELLARHFPRPEGAANQLHNELRFLD
jgi:putative membrane protein